VIFYFIFLSSLFKGGIDLFLQFIIFFFLFIYILLKKEKLDFNPLYLVFLIMPLINSLSFASIRIFYVFLIYLMIFSLEIGKRRLIPIFLILYLSILISLFIKLPFFGNINIKLAYFVILYIFLFEYFSTSMRIIFLLPVLFSLVHYRAILSLIVLISFFIFFFKKKTYFILFVLGLGVFFYIALSKGFWIDRIKWFKLTIFLFKEHFLKGIGWGNFRYYVPCFFKGSLRTLYAHTSFFQLLSEGGFSFILFLSLIFLFFKIEKKYLFFPLLLFLIFDYYIYIPSWGMAFVLVFRNSLKRRISFRIKKLYFILIYTVLGIFYIKVYFSDVYFAKANYFLTKKELNKAEIYYRKSIKTFKYHYTSFAGVGIVKYIEGNFDEAIKFVKKAVVIKNKDFPAMIYIEKAESFLKNGKIEEFHKYFKKSVSFLFLLEGVTA